MCIGIFRARASVSRGSDAIALRGGFTSAILPRFWHPAPACSDPPVRTPTVPPVFRRPNPAGRRSASQSTGEGVVGLHEIRVTDAIVFGELQLRALRGQRIVRDEQQIVVLMDFMKA